MPNWAEQVTAVATVVLAVGAVGAIGAAVVAGQQVRRAAGPAGRGGGRLLKTLERRPDGRDPAAGRVVRSPEALRDVFLGHIAANDTEAYVLYRELDYFEQLGALRSTAGSTSS